MPRHPAPPIRRVRALGASKEFVATVRNAGDLVRLVSEYVTLRPAGKRLKGLCPFHHEKTPSFTVDPEQQLFYCFGCQAGGDIFKFVQAYEKLDFVQSVEFLARRFGVAIPSAGKPSDDPRGRVIEVNEAAQRFFRSQLLDPVAGGRAREYLNRRGISETIAETLGLGYAPDRWDALRDHLGSKRFRMEDIEASGLVKPRDSGSGWYDRFRDRLIFPIRDLDRRTIAFGGRSIGTGEPKYLNSPETRAYVKGEHLYGLDQAREAARREGYAIVVEGYVDLAAVKQAGFDNVVASCGTAFTPVHAKLLTRFTSRVVVSFDGDAAGGNAAVRSLDILLERGLDVRVAELPGGMDPDDFIRAHGAAAYGALVRQAPGYFEFLIRRETRGRDLANPEERVGAVNALLPHLAKLSNSIERTEWASRVADAARVDDALVLQELQAALRAGRPSIRHRVESMEPIPDVEARLCVLLMTHEEARERARLGLTAADLDGARTGPIVDAILRLDAHGLPVTAHAVADALADDAQRALFTRITFRDEPPGEMDQFEGCLEALRCRRLRREGRELGRIPAESDAAWAAIAARKLALAREIDTLSERRPEEDR